MARKIDRTPSGRAIIHDGKTIIHPSEIITRIWDDGNVQLGNGESFSNVQVLEVGEMIKFKLSINGSVFIVAIKRFEDEIIKVNPPIKLSERKVTEHKLEVKPTRDVKRRSAEIFNLDRARWLRK